MRCGISDEPIEYAESKLVRNRTVLPTGLAIGGSELGKGANNRVVEASWDGAPCVVRMPRRKSETQQRGAAKWEFCHTLAASQLGVAPAVLAAWYAKHATASYPSGLYMVSERYDSDLEDLMLSARRRDAMIAHSDAIADSICRSLARLAGAGMLLYDLKPSNIVANVGEGIEAAEVRLIDFGHEFCEWAGARGRKECASAPTIALVDRLVGGDAGRRAHVLFAVMLVQLAATTTDRLFHTRRDSRMDDATRREINGIARAAARLLESMQGRHLAALREVLRTDEVRGVMGHYHGRRNAGTRRTLRLARGVAR